MSCIPHRRLAYIGLGTMGFTARLPFNGVTELLDHRKTRQSPHQRLTSLWFGDNYRVKARAFSIAQQKAEAWKN